MPTESSSTCPRRIDQASHLAALCDLSDICRCQFACGCSSRQVPGLDSQRPESTPGQPRADTANDGSPWTDIEPEATLADRAATQSGRATNVSGDLQFQRM